MRHPLSSVDSVSINSAGRQAITGSSNAPPLLWDITSAKGIKRFDGYSRARFGGKYILLSGQDKTLHLWDADTRKSLNKLQGGYATFSRDGRFVVESFSDGKLKVWETATGKEVLNYAEPSGKIRGFGLAANNRFLLVILDKAVKRIEIATGEEERFNWADPYQWDSAISPDGRFIAVIVANKDFKNSLKLFDVETKREIRSYERVIPAASVVFSPDSRKILFSVDRRLVLGDVFTGAELKSFAGHTDSVWYLNFSLEGEQIISASTDRKIKLWDSATGQEIVSFVGHQSNVRQALMSPNGKQVISVGDDGTTRFWDIATGKEQARFLSFTDGEWIAMTPDGYYTGSEQADKYVNVRIGNNAYGVGQYREKFYRPEVVMAALAGKPVTELASLGSVKPAPSVSIVETPGSVATDETTVKVKVSDNGGGIGDVRLYLNGSAVMLDRTRNLAVAEAQGKAQVFSYKLRLVAGNNTVRAIAFNAGNSMQSTDATHEIEAKIAMAKPSLHALVIGIQEYENPSLTLNYPVGDAKLVAATLRERAKGLFEGVNIVELTTRLKTTKDAIAETLKKMSEKIGPNDLFVFFVASHGTVDDGEYFLITSNVGSTSTHILKQTALSQDDLKALIANVPATKKLVLIDTCNAGKLGEAIQMAVLTRGMNQDTAIKILSRAVGSTVISASTSVQEALEGYKDHGLFTWVIVEGLKGAADSDKDGYVKTHELVNYVDSQVPELAERVFRHKQYPTTSLSGQGFPLVRVK